MTKKEAVTSTELTEYEITQVKKRVSLILQAPKLLCKGKTRKVRIELFRIEVLDLLSCGNLDCFEKKVNALPGQLNEAMGELQRQTKITLRVTGGTIIASYTTAETDESFALRLAKAEERDDKLLQRELYAAKKRKYLSRTKTKKHRKR
jgi:hypothetical protein